MGLPTIRLFDFTWFLCPIVLLLLLLLLLFLHINCQLVLLAFEQHKPPKPYTTTQPKAISFKYLIFDSAKMSKWMQLSLLISAWLLSRFFACVKCSLTVDSFFNFLFVDNDHAANFIRLTASQSLQRLFIVHLSLSFILLPRSSLSSKSWRQF